MLYVLDGPDIYMNFDESTNGGSLIGYKLTGSPINGAGLVTDHFKSGKALYLDGKCGILWDWIRITAHDKINISSISLASDCKRFT